MLNYGGNYFLWCINMSHKWVIFSFSPLGFNFLIEQGHMRNQNSAWVATFSINLEKYAKEGFTLNKRNQIDIAFK